MPPIFALEGSPQFIALIAPVGEDVTQPWEGRSDGFEDYWHAVAVLHIGPVNDPIQQKSIGISEDVSLAAYDFLGSTKARYSATLGGLDVLAVDHTLRGQGLPSARFAHLHQQTELFPPF